MNQETCDKLFEILDDNREFAVEILKDAVYNVESRKVYEKSFGRDLTNKEYRDLVKLMCKIAKIIDG